MYAVYLTSFLIGGTLMVGQFVLGLIGLGHHLGDHDVHAGHDHGHGGDHGHDGVGGWFLSLLTFRTTVAALTFFGLGGLAAGGALDWPWALAVALAAGAGALVLVGSLMRALGRLKADGTVRIEGAVGTTGTVYLSVPGNKAGKGKVTLLLQNRTMEYLAMTPTQDLPTGAKVVVTAVLGTDTVEVVPVTDSGSPAHA
jgi:membrane protein implicated in regulation of membrane protease activity